MYRQIGVYILIYIYIWVCVSSASMCICDSRLQRIWIKEQSVLIIRLRRGKKVGYEIEQYPVAIWSPIGTGHIVMTDPAQLTNILLVDQIADFRRMFADPLENMLSKHPFLLNPWL